ncbi:MAG: hypothetical protein AB2392_16065 [Neobacillus sp.]
MSKSLWITPEELIQRKKRNKNLLYASFMVASVILSTFVTLLANQL